MIIMAKLKMKLYRVKHENAHAKKTEVLVVAPSKKVAIRMVDDEYGVTMVENGTQAKRVKMKKPAIFVISGPLVLETNEKN